MSMSRREFTLRALPLVIAPALWSTGAGAQGAGAQPRGDAIPKKTKWIDDVLAQLDSKGKPTDGLRLGRFKDPMYFLLNPISWHPDPTDPPGLPSITVPTGFVTDLASIPQIFWSILRPDGDYAYPAILHDYLYWMQNTDRATADLVLKTGMSDFGVASWKIEAIYKAVRAGGQSAWDGNAKLRAGGERRFLKKYPDDPRETWSHWKTKPGVFA